MQEMDSKIEKRILIRMNLARENTVEDTDLIAPSEGSPMKRKKKLTKSLIATPELRKLRF